MPFPTLAVKYARIQVFLFCRRLAEDLGRMRMCLRSQGNSKMSRLVSEL